MTWNVTVSDSCHALMMPSPMVFGDEGNFKIRPFLQLRHAWVCSGMTWVCAGVCNGAAGCAGCTWVHSGANESTWVHSGPIDRTAVKWYHTALLDIRTTKNVFWAPRSSSSCMLCCAYVHAGVLKCGRWTRVVSGMLWSLSCTRVCFGAPCSQVKCAPGFAPGCDALKYLGVLGFIVAWLGFTWVCSLGCQEYSFSLLRN